MRFLLKLKHWQLFLLTWGGSFLVNFLVIFDPIWVFRAFPIVMLLFCIGVFGWVWAIATQLHAKLPEGVSLNVSRFKVLFSIPVIYLFAVTLWTSFSFGGTVFVGSDVNPLLIALLIIPLHLLSMFIIFWGIRFAAKTMKSVELGRMAHFGDYVGEFFLIWFCIVGYWILQPRLNRLVNDQD